MADVVTEILLAAGKHPNSRVSKLIHTVQEDPSQKNIILLLIELSEHAEYSIDFNISLKYYLELFDFLGINSDLVLNEAGLLLLNSSKIYSKRVDYLQSLVERQILTLSNADHELQKQKLNQQESSTESTTAVEKPKRGRKRALEVSSDPYELELVPKKFKKLSEEKRFSVQKTTVKAKSIQRNIEMEQHIHPAGWMHATIYDLDNEEDVDTKRNYKLFTYHVEHRYNTLVPDINFRLHFKVKDYIDAQEEEMDDDETCNKTRTWPPLSEAYIQKYLKLENYVLQQDIQYKKRKTKSLDDDDGNASENTEQFTNEDLSETPGDINQENHLNNTANNMDITVQHLNSSSMNDSGFGQSLLDESNKTDTTTDATQLDMTNMPSLNNTILDASSISNNLNGTSSLESDKSLGLTQTLREDDSALGTSLLDQSKTTELNSTLESSGYLDSTNCYETLNPATVEASANLNATHCDETSLVNTENKTESTEVSISETENKRQPMEFHESNDIDSKQLLKTTEVRKDSALSDDRHFSISMENLSIISNKTQEDTKKLSVIDIVENNDADHSQIRIHLPNMDDEGVYFSDLEEQDQRMLSPTITVTNVLPGVKRKDVTIIMDEELRQALELRDGIMEHFGREKFMIPVTTEPKKQNLYFNILKLPEKIIRKKVLFKLGPEMDLYLQARSLKRHRLDPQPREYRTTKLLQWFSLNNTDMSGIIMTPPNSPGHCSDFCGFTDDESDDDISCSEFYGFSAEEQSAIQLANLNRLSRDSGVGFDVNQLTPEKDFLDNSFAEQEESVSQLDVDNCKRNLNFGENQESNNETTESIINQLSTDIREALNAEINDETTAKELCANQTDTLVTEENDCQKLSTELENSTHNSELSETLSPEKSSEAEQLNSTSSTEETEKLQELQKNTETNNDIEMSCDQSQKPEELNINGEIVTENKNCDETSVDLNDTFDDCHADEDVEDSEDDETFIDLDTQGNKTKIQLWHQHLKPILANSKERHHFDVFKLGTEIIETVQTKIQTEEATMSFTSPSSPPVALFNDIMDNKDKSYVSRYFLSTLLLANQSNLEISLNNKSSEHPSSWNDVQLKLLSTKRHTVAIEDNIGMINKNKKTSQKEKETNARTKVKATQQSPMEVEEEDDDKPLLKLQVAAKSNKKSKIVHKRISDNIISSLAEKKSKGNFTTTQEKNLFRPNDESSLITNVQILPSLITTTAIIDDDNTSLASPFSLPQFIDSTEMACTSRQTKDLQTLEVNLDSLQTLKPIQKVPRNSDDYDSGIFSIDELST